jgi:hypothetical protein
VGITSAALPPKDAVTGDTAAEVAALALYYKLLIGVRVLGRVCVVIRGGSKHGSRQR